MNYAILGANGALGKALNLYLKKNKRTFKSFPKEELDVTLPSDFSRLEPFDVVINASAYTDVNQAEKQPEKAYLINAKAVGDLASFTKKTGKKLIHFSTDYVFDGKKRAPYEEKEATKAINAYGKSKEAGEKLLFLHNPKALLIRTSWLFSLTHPSFVTKILELFETKKEIFVVEDQLGKPTYVEDLALATLQLEKLSGIYHFSNREEVSWYEFAKEIWNIRKQYGKTYLEKISPKVSASPVKRPAYSVLSTKKYENEISSIRSWKEPLKTLIKMQGAAL